MASTLGSGLFIACIMTAAILLLGSIQISDKVCQASVSSLCSPACQLLRCSYHSADDAALECVMGLGGADTCLCSPAPALCCAFFAVAGLQQPLQN